MEIDSHIVEYKCEISIYPRICWPICWPMIGRRLDLKLVKVEDINNERFIATEWSHYTRQLSHDAIFHQDVNEKVIRTWNKYSSVLNTKLAYEVLVHPL